MACCTAKNQLAIGRSRLLRSVVERHKQLLTVLEAHGALIVRIWYTARGTTDTETGDRGGVDARKGASMLSFNLPAFVADNSAIIMIIASAITLPMAWISDAALRDLGFGYVGNYVLLWIGCLLGAGGVMLHVGSAERFLANMQWSFLAAAAGAVTTILTACLVKRLLPR